ncbi:hypothetical protein [Luteimicrobium album]|uniref:hypothetical protein n=1 Tax=Luteimicrobium album TaxID=1054550 RepID=UPI0024E0BC75|nr:hypothetical protein [Luteimicrobium album]
MTDCIFCGEPAVWLHRLDARLAGFRYDGEGRTFGGDVGTCAGCEALWAAGDDEAIVARCVGRRDGEGWPRPRLASRSRCFAERTSVRCGATTCSRPERSPCVTPGSPRSRT